VTRPLDSPSLLRCKFSGSRLVFPLFFGAYEDEPPQIYPPMRPLSRFRPMMVPFLPPPYDLFPTVDHDLGPVVMV